MYKYDDSIEILNKLFVEMKEIFELDSEYYEDIPYVFYETEFLKFILKKLDEKNNETLIKIFEFIETVLEVGDNEFINLIDVAIIESIYFARNELDMDYMKTFFGVNTLKSYQKCG